MPVHTSAIRAFLRKWETSQTIAYIPCRRRNFTGRTGSTGHTGSTGGTDFLQCGEVIASSGVTIGTGVDLGQQTEDGLRGMGVPAALVARFRPYLGKTRELAVFALERAPLTLTADECAALDTAVHAAYIRRAASAYDKAAGFRFDGIPAEAQTVIVSLFYQLGNGPKAYPKTWALLCAGAWAEAAHELKTGFSKYASRRLDEGRLLDRIPHL